MKQQGSQTHHLRDKGFLKNKAELWHRAKEHMQHRDQEEEEDEDSISQKGKEQNFYNHIKIPPLGPHTQPPSQKATPEWWF